MSQRVIERAINLPISNEMPSNGAALGEAAFVLSRAIEEGPASECALIRAELAQLQSLVTSAIGTLQRSFSELAELVRSQCRTWDGLLTVVDTARREGPQGMN